jgi:hypothetical protein
VREKTDATRLTFPEECRSAIRPVVQAPISLAPLSYQLAEARPGQIQISSIGGRDHVVRFVVPQVAMPPQGPPRSAGSELAGPATTAPPNEPDEPPLPDEPAEAKTVRATQAPPTPERESDSRPGETDVDRLYREMSVRGPSNRRGGREAGRRRTRHPLVDLETGKILEFQNSEDGQYIPGSGKSATIENIYCGWRSCRRRSWRRRRRSPSRCRPGTG